MVTIIWGAAAWLSYEVLVGVQVIRGEHFSYGKKRPYVPPTVLFSEDREKYLDWKEWKGDRFE